MAEETEMEMVEVAPGDVRRMTKEDAKAFRKTVEKDDAQPAEAGAPAAPEAATLVTSRTATMPRAEGKARGKG